MQITLKTSFKSVVLAGLALAVWLVLQTAGAPVVSAQGGEGQAVEAADDSYTYTAQPGDSYTKIARKAVQTYGIENNVKLSEAGIIFAETNLTLSAGSPQLEVGQEVKLSKELVKQYVDEANALSDAQQNAWAVYVPLIDFNTDAIGQNS